MPASSSRPASLVIALLWVSLWEPLAPSSRRATWRDQWRADLWHYSVWLSRQGHPPLSCALKLFARAWACLPHAALLRTQEWSLHMLLHDLKFAWRMTVRRPAFTAVAILILGLGIGANATIFSWVESILMRPLPGVADQDRLVALRGTSGDRTDLSFSYPNFQDLRDARPDGFEDLVATRGLALNLRAAGEPQRLWGQLVTPNFFDVMRVRPAAGRTFAAADGAAAGREPVAVISHRLWQRSFGGDPATVGRAISINGRPFTVIGVAAEGFRGSMGGVLLDVFVPVTMQQTFMSGDRLPERGSGFLQVMGRLAPGADIGRAQASADVVAARLAAAHPGFNEGHGIRVNPLWRDGVAGMLLPVMVTLMAVVGVVMLIACANLAGLLLARGAGRTREVAVRLAVGASRGRLIRQFLIESLLLAAGGGAAGLVLSYWTTGALARLMPPTPYPIDLGGHVSPAVLGFACTLTAITALVFGLVPALRASRPDVSASLKDTAAGAGGGHARGRLRQALVVGQVALSLVLLVCAALFLRSLSRAHTIDPGFSMRQGVIAAIDLLPNGYDAQRGVVFYEQLLADVREIRGVAAATVSSAVPLDLNSSDMGVKVDGYVPADGEQMDAYYNRVAPDYFQTLGVAIVRGRAIDARDVEGRELSIVINETMARRYWAGRDALGGIVRFGSGPARVVGIARDGKYGRLGEAPRNYIYVPVYQYFRPDVLLQVRTAGEPAAIIPAIQEAVKRLDPNLPLFDVRTMEEHLELSVFVPRLGGLLLGLFGALALLLAVVGLYSVVAFNVAQRTREIGVRMALGAGRREILGMVLGQGFRIISIGLGVGLLLAIGAAQALESQLTGLSPMDPVSFGGTTLILLAVALTACALPARRAAGLDPLTALRRD